MPSKGFPRTWQTRVSTASDFSRTASATPFPKLAQPDKTTGRQASKKQFIMGRFILVLIIIIQIVEKNSLGDQSNTMINQ